MSAAFTHMITALCHDTVAEMPVTIIPYAQFLGLHVQVNDNILTVRMPFDFKLIGNPQPQRLHGGVIGGLLEFTGALTVARAFALANLGRDIPMPKPLNISLDYLRAGGPQDTFASASITRLGRRVANVRADAWQSARDKLITAAHMNVVLG